MLSRSQQSTVAWYASTASILLASVKPPAGILVAGRPRMLRMSRRRGRRQCCRATGPHFLGRGGVHRRRLFHASSGAGLQGGFGFLMNTSLRFRRRRALK
jgi:hypothetical protein